MAQFSAKAIGSWVISQNEKEQSYTVHKTFDDGTDVIIVISKSSEKYILYSTAECRTSGPSQSLVGSYSSLDEAVEAVERECEDWELHLSSDRCYRR